MSSSSFHRSGAIDLSQLAAKRPPAGPGGAGGSTGHARASYVLEVTERSFETDVIRRSMQHPVVVELYSPRVATGQQLSTALAELAAEAGGKYLLARINVDTAPQIVQALQLQAVPSVVGIVGGRLVQLFQGVLGKAEAAPYLDQLLQMAVTNGIVGRAEPVGADGAAADADAEPEPDPRFAAADAALERGDFAAAEAEFQALLQADPADAEAKAGLAQASLLRRTGAADPSATLARADAAGATIDEQLAGADVELVLGRADAAFARLIALIRESSGAERERVRTRLLELFDTVGGTDPRVVKARRDLMTALF